MSADSLRLQGRARSIAEQISAADAGVQAVVLYGSAAAGTAGPASDLDLLLVFDDRANVAALRERAPDLFAADVNRSFYRAATLRRLRTPSHWAYVEHVRRWGIALIEHPDLNDVLCVPRPSGDQLAGDLEDWATRTLRPYDGEPRRMNGLYALGLARIFKVARSAVMLANAHSDVFEHDRAAAFDAFAARVPQAAGHLERLRALERCWMYEQGGRDVDGWQAARDVCPDDDTFQALMDGCWSLVAAAASCMRAPDKVAA